MPQKRGGSCSALLGLSSRIVLNLLPGIATFGCHLRLDERRPRADGRYSRRSKLPCRRDCRRALVVLARAVRPTWCAVPVLTGRASRGCGAESEPVAHRLRPARRGLPARPARPAGRPRGLKSAVFYPKSGKLPVRGGSERQDAAQRVVRARRRHGFAGAGHPGAGHPDAGHPDAGQPDAGQPDARLCARSARRPRRACDCMQRWNAAVRSRTIV
ncbi:hypothetical protein QFZ97_002453 [Paraburkholderia youngii]